MTRERAIELAKKCAAECIQSGEVKPEPWGVVDRDTHADIGLASAWIVHFEYILPEDVAIQCPSSLIVEIVKQTAKATLMEKPLKRGGFRCPPITSTTK